MTSVHREWDIMANPGLSAESRIMCLLKPGRTLTVEQVVSHLPEIRWGQVFRAIKVLNERGKLVLRVRGFDCEMSCADGVGAGKGFTGGIEQGQIWRASFGSPVQVGGSSKPLGASGS